MAVSQSTMRVKERVRLPPGAWHNGMFLLNSTLLLEPCYQLSCFRNPKCLKYYYLLYKAGCVSINGWCFRAASDHHDPGTSQTPQSMCWRFQKPYGIHSIKHSSVAGLHITSLQMYTVSFFCFTNYLGIKQSGNMN